MNERQRLNYLQAMGLQQWIVRQPEELSRESEQALPVQMDEISLPECEVHEITVTSDRIIPWDDLKNQVASCTQCSLHQSRTQTVFGVGDRQADWMLIGEAPGQQEDEQGEPFVGPAGMLLNEILFSLGLQRQTVFIANILKCRPPNNRDPLPDEIQSCSSFLEQQVKHVAPRIILTLGRIAAQNLLHTTESIGRLRGRVHDYQSIPVIVMYHPAYLLRSPTEKRKVLQDLLLAKQTLDQIDAG
ncbi:MAG: uracil-DNA glycosylase [Gammaproteobacteria bacterium]|nr:uracil-DNA glycosylase [Gammaproteobacteria bacterium]